MLSTACDRRTGEPPAGGPFSWRGRPPVDPWPAGKAGVHRSNLDAIALSGWFSVPMARPRAVHRGMSSTRSCSVTFVKGSLQRSEPSGSPGRPAESTGSAQRQRGSAEWQSPFNRPPVSLSPTGAPLPTNRRVVLQARLIGERRHHASWLQLASKLQGFDHPSTDRVKVFGKYLGRRIGRLPPCRDSHPVEPVQRDRVQHVALRPGIL